MAPHAEWVDELVADVELRPDEAVAFVARMGEWDLYLGCVGPILVRVGQRPPTAAEQRAEELCGREDFVNPPWEGPSDSTAAAFCTATCE